MAEVSRTPISAREVWIGDDGRRWVSEAEFVAEVERRQEALEKIAASNLVCHGELVDIAREALRPQTEGS